MSRDAWALLKADLQEHVLGEAEYAGFPVPVHGYRVAMSERHPRFADWEGWTLGAREAEGHREFVCTTDQVETPIVNEWWSRRLGTMVYVEDRDGRRSCLHEPYTVELAAVRRWDMTFATVAIGHEAWEVEAEIRALETLGDHISRPQQSLYLLHGLFFEASKRSQARYVFRRSRPTIVLLPGRSGLLSPSVTLCHHPLAYYQGTFAGGMVPSDDVLAALLLMRSDEAGYWKRSNQHPIDRPEAGL